VDPYACRTKVAESSLETKNRVLSMIARLEQALRQ